MKVLRGYDDGSQEHPSTASDRLRRRLAEIARATEPLWVVPLEIQDRRFDAEEVVQGELEGGEGCSGSTYRFLNEYSQRKDLGVQYWNGLIRPNGLNQ